MFTKLFWRNPYWTKSVKAISINFYVFPTYLAVKHVVLEERDLTLLLASKISNGLINNRKNSESIAEKCYQLAIGRWDNESTGLRLKNLRRNSATGRLYRCSYKQHSWWNILTCRPAKYIDFQLRLWTEIECPSNLKNHNRKMELS